MGITICERHGRSGMDLVCSHISRDMSSGVEPEKIISADFNFGYFPGDPIVPIECTIFYCPECVRERSFPAEDCKLPDSAYDSMVENGFVGVCTYCFKEFVDSLVFKEFIDE